MIVRETIFFYFNFYLRWWVVEGRCVMHKTIKMWIHLSLGGEFYRLRDGSYIKHRHFQSKMGHGF